MLGPHKILKKLKVLRLANNYSAFSGIFIGAQGQKKNKRFKHLVLAVKKMGIVNDV